MIKAVIFDFGGVLAEEGFAEGLRAIGKQNGLNPDNFFAAASELVYKTGYVTGMSDEATYWDTLRVKTGIYGDDEKLRKEILVRFKLRPEIFKLITKLKSYGIVTAILSDQTNWLEEIDRKTPFYHHFDYVFNSFRLKKSKKDPSVFAFVCSETGFKPEEILFIDDNIENIKRASENGLKTIHFKNKKDFENELQSYTL